MCWAPVLLGRFILCPGFFVEDQALNSHSFSTLVRNPSGAADVLIGIYGELTSTVE